MKHSASRRFFLAAYAASGLAGLIYELTWTRLLTLYMGHTTAAASTVAAAFMGGLAGGAFIAGRTASALSPRRTLQAYIGLELIVALFALGLPWVLRASVPVLALAYQDGGGGLAFPAVRLVLCLVTVLVPAVALGATFPMAVRWFVRDSPQTGRRAGELYAVNTLGAALGALAAGFALIPAVGMSGTTLVGVGASMVAVFVVLRLLQASTEGHQGGSASGSPATTARMRAGRRQHEGPPREVVESAAPALVIAAVVLGVSGFATMMFEIAWVRVLSLLVGPTTYAFAATLATLITGLAVGSAIGSWLAGRTGRPALWLSISMAATAMATSWSTAFVGREGPRLIADPLASSGSILAGLISGHPVMIAAWIIPTALGLGVGFPLALELVGSESGIARRVGLVYSVNTLAALAGSLVAGFISIPVLSVQPTLQVVSAMMLLGAGVAVAGPILPLRLRAVGLAVIAVALVPFVWNPPWDRELLASGVYKNARRTDPGVDPITMLRAGELLYYRDGAASTVSVKRLTGVISMSIDGKVDASSSGDMLTQKLLGHLPLLLHPDPHRVLVIGLGSGVTAASALVHPISQLDVVEISPEVVQASQVLQRPEQACAPGCPYAPDSRRWPVTPAPVPPAVRRHRLGAIQPVDGRSRGAVHPGVLRSRASPPGTGRRDLPVGAHLRHWRG